MTPIDLLCVLAYLGIGISVAAVHRAFVSRQPTDLTNLVGVALLWPIHLLGWAAGVIGALVVWFWRAKL